MMATRRQIELEDRKRSSFFITSAWDLTAGGIWQGEYEITREQADAFL